MRIIWRVLPLVIWLNGCALTTERVDITCFPQTGVAVIAGADKVVVSVSVNDQRQERGNRVSSKKNGFGMEMAPILANEEVTVIIRRAMEQELQARGFSLGEQAVVAVTADLYRFWNDHKVGFFAGDSVAELSLGISVKNRGGMLLYASSIHVQGVEENIQLMGGNNARLALNKALENGMEKLFGDEKFVKTLLAGAGR